MVRTGEIAQNADHANIFLNVVPQLRALDIQFVSLQDGKATIKLPYADKLIGFPETGVLAGGAIYTLMDSVAGISVFSALGQFVPMATLDLRIDYLKPAVPGEDVYGEARCYKLTRKVAFVRGRAHHGDPERPIAHISGTFFVDRPDTAKASPKTAEPDV
ncbi:MAG: PaaI family thioesterase [Pseudomonadota bacterium]